MRRWARRTGRTTAAAVLAMFALTTTASPGWAAPHYPKPHSNEWWFTTWGVQDKLWPISQGEGVTVAVLDTGIDNLPDFSGRLIGGVDLTGGGNPGMARAFPLS